MNLVLHFVFRALEVMFFAGLCRIFGCRNCRIYRRRAEFFKKD